MNGILDLGVIREPVLIFGGPYSNLQASEAIQDRARQHGISPQRIICTGDVVAYCAEPEATARLLRAWGIHVIQGNCEESLSADAKDCGCGFAPGSACDVLTESWYPFALQQLSGVSKTWMRNLPRSIRFAIQGRDFLVVHGGVLQNNRFIFASTSADEMGAELARSGADCVIGGHCGLPFGQLLDDKLWLNAGVIGMPANDGTQDGWYLLLEPVTGAVQVSWQRLAYDAQAAFADMQVAGLSNGYAAALLSGLWPSMDVLPQKERQQQGRAIHLPEMRF